MTDIYFSDDNFRRAPAMLTAFCMSDTNQVLASSRKDSGRFQRSISSEINASLRCGTGDEMLTYGLKRYNADFLEDVAQSVRRSI